MIVQMIKTHTGFKFSIDQIFNEYKDRDQDANVCQKVKPKGYYCIYLLIEARLRQGCHSQLTRWCDEPVR